MKTTIKKATKVVKKAKKSAKPVKATKKTAKKTPKKNVPDFDPMKIMKLLMETSGGDKKHPAYVGAHTIYILMTQVDELEKFINTVTDAVSDVVLSQLKKFG